MTRPPDLRTPCGWETADVRKLTPATGPTNSLAGGYGSQAETDLADRFVRSVKNHPKALRKSVESYPRFNDEGFNLSDIFREC